MTMQTDERRDLDLSVERRSIRQPHRITWPLALLVAVTIAGGAGVYVAANLTNAPATPPTIYHEPNANTREGRVPAKTVQEPNANTREDRVPTKTVQEPNANTREGRVPSNN